MARLPKVPGLTPVEIPSEEEAWDFLERLHGGGFEDAGLLPHLTRWPRLDVTFRIGSERAALTAPVMEALLDYQAAINRAFMLVGEGTTSLRGLAERERQAYETVFKVRAGSTGVVVDLQQAVIEFTRAAAASLSGRQVATLALAFALVFGGQTCWRAWLEHQREVTEMETSNAQVRELLETQRYATEAEMRRMELLQQTIESAMGSRSLVEASNDSRKSLLKAAARVSDTSIAGQVIPPEVARPLSRSTRALAQKSTVTGEFEVIRVDSDVPGGFRVRLRESRTGNAFFASIRDRLLSETERALIQRGEWEKKPIVATVHLTRRRGVVAAAGIGEVLGVVGG